MRCGLFCIAQHRESVLIHHNLFSNTRWTNKLGGHSLVLVYHIATGTLWWKRRFGRLTSGRLTEIHCMYIMLCVFYHSSRYCGA